MKGLALGGVLAVLVSLGSGDTVERVPEQISRPQNPAAEGQDKPEQPIISVQGSQPAERSMLFPRLPSNEGFFSAPPPDLPSSYQAQPEPRKPKPDMKIMVKTTIGCRTISHTEQMLSLIRSGDAEAAAKYYVVQKHLGICQKLEEDTDVSIAKDSLTGESHYGGSFCVRPLGDPNCYWTAMENFR